MSVTRKAEQHEQKTGDPYETSQSMIKSWRRCHALYDYRYVQLLERRRPVVQLIRGTMVGKCLDALALLRTNPKAPKVDKVLEPFEKEYGKLFKAEQEYYGPVIEEVRRIVSKYQEIYANDGLTYLTPPKGAGLSTTPYELPVRVDMAPGIVFTGHIDKMPRDKQGRVWDMDHKSHKHIPGPDDRFSDLQQLFYQWAMPLSGYPKPAGVMWDYLRTKPPTVPPTLKEGGLSQKKDIDTTWEVYLGEINRLKLKPKDYKKMEVILKPRGNMDFYQRVPLPSPNKVMIENAVADAKASSIDMKTHGGVDKTRSMDRTCKSCEFFNLCQTEFRGLDSSHIRKTDYRTQTDPRHIHIVRDEE